MMKSNPSFELGRRQFSSQRTLFLIVTHAQTQLVCTCKKDTLAYNQMQRKVFSSLKSEKIDTMSYVNAAF